MHMWRHVILKDVGSVKEFADVSPSVLINHKLAAWVTILKFIKADHDILNKGDIISVSYSLVVFLNSYNG